MFTVFVIVQFDSFLFIYLFSYRFSASIPFTAALAALVIRSGEMLIPGLNRAKHTKVQKRNVLFYSFTLVGVIFVSTLLSVRLKMFTSWKQKKTNKKKTFCPVSCTYSIPLPIPIPLIQQDGGRRADRDLPSWFRSLSGCRGQAGWGTESFRDKTWYSTWW